MPALERSVARVRRFLPRARPVCGLILGSGWAKVAEAFRIRRRVDYAAIPVLGPTTVVGHPGRLLWAELAGIETFVFQGRRHWYEGAGWDPVAAPVCLLKSFGASIIVITNAAGGIRGDLRPGAIMLIDDHINAMGVNPLIGPCGPVWGPRFADMTSVYDPRLRVLCRKAARTAGEDLRHGVYLATTGPSFETPAEIAAFRRLGADAVGMSTVPEAILAHAAGLRVLGLSCISNRAAGAGGTKLTHEGIAATVTAAAPRMRALLKETWIRMAREL